MRNTILLFIISIVLLSCKTKTAVANSGNSSDSTQVKPSGNSPKDINKPIGDKIAFYSKILLPPKFEHIKMSSKIEVIADNYIPVLDATIYVENDQKIYANLNAFMGLTGAKSLITPEGLKAYVRTNKTYIDSDFDYLNKLLNVNFIDYKAVEKILIGRTFIPVNDRQFIATKTTQGYKLASIGNQRMETEEGNREYKIALFYNNDYDLTRVDLQDVASSDALEIGYDGWETYNNIRLPKNVKIIIKGSKKSQILIENTKFDLSKMDTRYVVPQNYKKIEIS